MKRTFVALLILAAFGHSTLVVCSGWSDSAAVRAACCHAANCPQAADDCCARGETQQHAQVLQSVARAVVPTFLLIVSEHPNDGRTPLVAGVPVSALTHRPDTYLLLSVLLV